MKNKIMLSILGIIFVIVTIGLLTNSCKVQADTKQVNIHFQWTTVGDDGLLGAASVYSLRYSMISDSLVNNWNLCKSITGLPTPAAASGLIDSVNTSLNLNTETTYYFAIKAADNVNNWSGISNIKSLTIADDIAPAAIIDFNGVIK